MAKAMVEALAMRIDALEKSDKTAAMRIDALEKDIALRFQGMEVKEVKEAKEQKGVKAAKVVKEKKVKPLVDDKPKEKRVTGYILFSNDVRDDVKIQLSGADDKPKNTDVMTEIARQWKALDTKDRDDWNAKAANAKAKAANAQTQAAPTEDKNKLKKNIISKDTDDDDDDDDDDDEDE